jgi:uncharacterized protein DUF4145
MLDNLDEFIKGLNTVRQTVFNYNSSGTAGNLHCTRCGGPRRVHISKVAAPLVGGGVMPNRKNLAPSMFLLKCVQCDNEWTAAIHTGPQGIELALFDSGQGGLTTPHTPQSVGYYLDQAARAQSVSANSAAIAMFRAALDHLFFEQGYTSGMLGKRIETLEKDITAGTGPGWAREVTPELLSVIKDLGNASIHTNDGDASSQSLLDSELLRRVTEAFVLILFVVYESPQKKKELLEALKHKLTELE